ncbi:alpha-protein kinase vwka [Anaeramoeba flamelloides]|uniref:Alpha-protein kinase vwka n=1 Tax=Anaeramoeba flamelloides TaxID=1746091 RepID=A0AAV8A0H1_9EUKA|nr:alpha-protein kinase vwka [Anaeramoeba flamelloides]
MSVTSSNNSDSDLSSYENSSREKDSSYSGSSPPSKHSTYSSDSSLSENQSPIKSQKKIKRKIQKKNITKKTDHKHKKTKKNRHNKKIKKEKEKEKTKTKKKKGNTKKSKKKTKNMKNDSSTTLSESTEGMESSDKKKGSNKKTKKTDHKHKKTKKNRHNKKNKKEKEKRKTKKKKGNTKKSQKKTKNMKNNSSSTASESTNYEELIGIKKDSNGSEQSSDEIESKSEQSYHEIEYSNSHSKNDNESECENENKPQEIDFTGIVKEEIEKNSKSSVDLCFLMDLTKSMDMDRLVQHVLREIKKIIQKITAKYLEHYIRLGFVGYRDDDVGETDQVIVQRFTSSCQKFIKFIQRVKVKGNSDFCEDIFLGFEEVLKMDWTSPNSILLHFADAPCHGTKYHNFFERFSKSDYARFDRYPDGNPKRQSGKYYMQQFQNRGIDYHFVKLTSYTDKMIKVFADYYDSDRLMLKLNVHELNSKSGQLDAIDNKQFIPMVMETIEQNQKMRTNILAEVSQSIVRGFNTNQRIPRFGDKKLWHPIEKVILYLPDTESDFSLDSILCKTEMKSVKIKMKVSSAISGQRKGITKRVSHLVELTSGYHFVTKEFIEEVDLQEAKRDYFGKMELMFILKHYVNLFNEKKLFQIVSVLDNFVCHFKTRDTTAHSYYSLQPFIPPNHHVNFQKAKSVNKHIREFFLTLSHFIYHTTKGKILFTDFKGYPNYMFITGATIHVSDDYKDRKFNQRKGNTRSINNWFSKHECNNMCESLKLDKHPNQKKGVRTVILSKKKNRNPLLCPNKLCGKYLLINLEDYPPQRKHVCTQCKDRIRKNKEVIIEKR